jgi:hypothetical protein
MKTKLIRVEQEEANCKEVDKIVNKEILSLEKQGFSVKDIRLAVGRDAWKNSGINIKYSVSIILIYE